MHGLAKHHLDMFHLRKRCISLHHSTRGLQFLWIISLFVVWYYCKYILKLIRDLSHTILKALLELIIGGKLWFLAKFIHGISRQEILQWFDNAACVRCDFLGLIVVYMDKACIPITLLKQRSLVEDICFNVFKVEFLQKIMVTISHILKSRKSTYII